MIRGAGGGDTKISLLIEGVSAVALKGFYGLHIFI